jgi:hypothetical protein
MSDVKERLQGGQFIIKTKNSATEFMLLYCDCNVKGEKKEVIFFCETFQDPRTSPW